MVNDVVWAWVLKPNFEHRKVYKNARIACAEYIEKISRIQQGNPNNKTKSGD